MTGTLFSLILDAFLRFQVYMLSLLDGNIFWTVLFCVYLGVIKMKHIWAVCVFISKELKKFFSKNGIFDGATILLFLYWINYKAGYTLQAIKQNIIIQNPKTPVEEVKEAADGKLDLFEEEKVFTMHVCVFSFVLRVAANRLNRFNIILSMLDIKSIYGSLLSEKNKFFVYEFLKGKYGMFSRIKYQRFPEASPVNFGSATFSDFSDESKLYGEVIINIEQTTKAMGFVNSITNPFVLLAFSVPFISSIVFLEVGSFVVALVLFGVILNGEIKHAYAFEGLMSMHLNNVKIRTKQNLLAIKAGNCPASYHTQSVFLDWFHEHAENLGIRVLKLEIEQKSDFAKASETKSIKSVKWGSINTGTEETNLAVVPRNISANRSKNKSILVNNQDHFNNQDRVNNNNNNLIINNEILDSPPSQRETRPPNIILRSFTDTKQKEQSRTGGRVLRKRETS